ncbi:MAG: Nif3-like dinuclear metal center hexameric protein [Armatimonadota bacterium]|nr:MAG: Nif3-like dinuclear metal center hexameric protein [Armatimonadota bacterium]
MVRLADLTGYLDDYLAIREIPDYPNAFNGLQVEGKEEVRRVLTAVDVSVASVEEAATWGADMLLVHHGLFWNGLQPIVGRFRRRLQPLLREGISLYAVHLPLDVHPEVGNNALLARALGFEPSGRFGDYQGTPVGVVCEANLPLAELVSRVETGLRTQVRVMPFGGDVTRRIGIITGGAGQTRILTEAYQQGIDTLLTGEGAHHTYLDAEELGINLLYAGHYATETLGVRALGEHLRRMFGLEHRFFDHPTGL